MIPFFANTTFSIRTYIKHITVGYAGLILRDVKISLDVVYHITINTKVNYNFDIIIPWIYILMYVVHKQRDIPVDSMLLSLSFDIGCCLLCCMVVWFSDCLSSLPPYPTKHRCTMNNNNICDHPPNHILHSLHLVTFPTNQCAEIHLCLFVSSYHLCVVSGNWAQIISVPVLHTSHNVWLSPIRTWARQDYHFIYTCAIICMLLCGIHSFHCWPNFIPIPLSHSSHPLTTVHEIKNRGWWHWWLMSVFYNFNHLLSI